MSNKNSNYPAAAQPKATPQEIGELVGSMDELRKLTPVSKRNPEQVEERLDYYFRYCADVGIKPTVEAMSLCLGVSRQTLWMWENDTESKAGQLVARAKELINSLLTTWTMNGKINAVYAIWLQKNNSGYSDTKTLEIKPQAEKPHISSLEQQIEDFGLVWDEQSGEYVPADDKGVRK